MNESLSLDEFRNGLDELQEELEYEDIRMMALQGIKNERMKES